MSSSPRPAPISPLATGLAAGEAVEVLPFAYGEALVRPGQTNFPRAERRLPGQGGSEPSAAKLATEREAQARELGRQQGLVECRTKFDEQLAKERGVLAQTLVDFARDRAAYYQKIEEECVRLALSIARKVLHREAQVDPLLLMGIVRVALEKIEGATGVALLVHPQQAEDWRRYLASRLDPAALPEIVQDPSIGLEQCRLRTSMGTSDLSLELQLKEVEQGLMDLLAARPQEKAGV
jgi:flagellar assembly protein FliH